MSVRSAILTLLLAVMLTGVAPAGSTAEPPGSRTARVKMLEYVESFEDFEKPKLEGTWHTSDGAKARLVNAGVTGGRQALEVTFGGPADTLSTRRAGLDGYGSSYSRSLEVLGARFIFHNRFSFDVLNPGKENVRLVVTIGRQPFVFGLKPGANTVTIPSEEIAAGVYRMTRVTHRIAFGVEGAKETALIFDSFRLERQSIGPNMAEYAKCIDFGPADMCRPGFTPVDHATGYDPRRGTGWLLPNTAGEKGRLATVESSGRMPLGDLIRDGVKDLSSPFAVDVPNGKYRVHIVSGYHWGGMYHLTPVDYDFTIRAEGEVKHLHLRASDHGERVRRMYGHDQTRYSFGEDVWSTFAKPIYGPVVFDVEVADGRLDLEFSTSPQPDKGFLNFMVVYPVDRAGAIEPELGELWRDIRHRYDRVSFRPLHPRLAIEMRKPDLHEEFVDPHRRAEKISILAARPEYSGRDYMLFARDHLDQVYPDTVPDPDEKVTRLEAAGSPGETVPVTFSMFALHPVERVRVDVSRLEGPGGREIPADRIDLRLVRYSRRMLAQENRGDWQYMVVPWYLVETRTVDLDRYMSRRFWLNVHLASELPPGEYTGRVLVRTARGATSQLKLDVTVEPFRLRAAEAGKFRAVYYVQPFNYGNEAYGQVVRRQKTERLPEEHAREVRGLFERLHRREIGAALGVLRESGFDTVYAGDWVKDMSEANAMLLEPLTLIDLSKAGRGIVARKVAVEGGFTTVDVDVAGRTAYLRTLASCDEAVIAGLKAEGLEVCFGRPATWVPLIDDPGVARFIPGIFLWRSGADALIAGPVRDHWGDPYNPFDGYGGERGSLMLPGSRSWPEVNTSRILEEMREGITDYRTLRTLEQLIAVLGDREEVSDAQNFLLRLRKNTSGKLADYFENTSAGTWRVRVEGAWDSARYNQFRRDASTHIRTLSDLLTGPPRTLPGPAVMP